MTEPVRLAKRVAEIKGCSRREAEMYIEGAWVRVEGKLMEEPAFKVAPNQRVEIDPKASLMGITPATILLHKPPGYESGIGEGVNAAGGPQGSRSRGAPPALQLLTRAAHEASDPSGIRMVSKHFTELTAPLPLPTEASGLVVFTQDPRILRKLVEDAETMEQEVIVGVAGEVSPEQLRSLSHGLSFNGRALPPIKVSMTSNNETATRLRFALRGIRPGQVPYMCENVGLRILDMKRIRIGRVPMTNLAPGQWRYLPAHDRF
ncbi:MAG: RNA-binding protein [Burkholderiaceae bacterium]|nr:RNA-binding protein [Burkholderiaceae bacterium]